MFGTISGLLACINLSVLIGKSQRMVIYEVSTADKGSRSYHLLGVLIPYWLQIFQCIYCLYTVSVYSFGARIVHLESKWLIVLVVVLQNLHVESAPLWKINTGLKVSSEKAQISAATINPSVSTFNAVLLNHWWLSCKSTSAFWLQSGFRSCNGFDFQEVFIAFFYSLPFSLACLFIFQAFSVFPMQILWQCEPFSFSYFEASCRIQSPDKFKYQNNTNCSCKAVRVSPNPSLLLLLGK